MTLKVRIVNEGNQPSDCMIFRGLKLIDGTTAQHTGNYEDKVTLMSGEGVDVYPSNTGHFDDFVGISYKGKH